MSAALCKGELSSRSLLGCCPWAMHGTGLVGIQAPAAPDTTAPAVGSKLYQPHPGQ